MNSIAELQTGTTPPTTISEYFGKGIPFIKPADITNNSINYNNESLTLLGAEKSRTIPKNSVLMVCIGGSIGKCYYTDIDVCCNQQINTATPFICNTQYLWNVMSSDYFQDNLRNNAGGTATPIINKSIWGELLIPLPPLAEQHRIVSQIAEIMPFIDNLTQ